MAWPSDPYGTQWPVRHRPRDVVDLLAAVLECSPKLDGAACRGQPPQMFDIEDPQGQADRLDAAIDVCCNCPALLACHQWASSQPPHALSGVVGGMFFPPRSYRGAQAS